MKLLSHPRGGCGTTDNTSTVEVVHVSPEWPIDPADLVTARGLVDRLGSDHPLLLPADGQGRLWVDFTQIEFLLSELIADNEAPQFSIDASPLMQLCQDHADEIVEEDAWTYPFFYLELLAHEGVLKPLLWGDPSVGSLLGEGEAVARHRSGCSLASGGRGSRCQAILISEAPGWVREGILRPDEGQPWLNYLRYTDPGADAPGERRFGDRLGFEKLPFYHLREAYARLIRAMKLELWPTSIFCPSPLRNQDNASFRKACDRFNLRYRRRTRQQARKYAFEDFVRDEWRSGTSKRGIARGLWPYGTRRGSLENPEDTEHCRRAVIRLIKERQAVWERQMQPPR